MVGVGEVSMTVSTVVISQFFDPTSSKRVLKDYVPFHKILIPKILNTLNCQNRYNSQQI